METTHTLVYRRTWLDRVGFLLGALAVLVAAFVMHAADLSMVLVRLAVGVAALLETVALVVNRLRIEVDDERIVVRRALFSQSMDWQDVTAYYLPKRSARIGVLAISAMTGSSTMISGTISGFSMVLESVNGKRLGVLGNLDPVESGNPPLGMLVWEKIMEHIYPDLRRTFDAGSPVEFGPVSLSLQSGLRFGKERIPPSELGRYSLILRKNRLALTQGQPQRADPMVRWDRLPDVDIFLKLFYELKNTTRTPSWA